MAGFLLVNSHCDDTDSAYAPIKRTQSQSGYATFSNKKPKTTEPEAEKPAALDIEKDMTPLLDLPAELRNSIYEKLLEGEPVSINRKGNLASPCALPLVSSQVRSEFLATLYLTAPTISVTVTDFNFTHIVRFLNRLTEKELNVLTVQSERRVEVLLDIVQPSWLVSSCNQYNGMNRQPRLPLSEPPQLHRWLKRVQNPTKRGTALDVVYKAVGRERDLKWWYSALGTMADECSAGRKKEELARMVGAMVFPT